MLDQKTGESFTVSSPRHVWSRLPPFAFSGANRSGPARRPRAERCYFEPGGRTLQTKEMVQAALPPRRRQSGVAAFSNGSRPRGSCVPLNLASGGGNQAWVTEKARGLGWLSVRASAWGSASGWVPEWAWSKQGRWA